MLKNNNIKTVFYHLIAITNVLGTVKFPTVRKCEPVEFNCIDMGESMSFLILVKLKSVSWNGPVSFPGNFVRKHGVTGSLKYQKRLFR